MGSEGGGTDLNLGTPVVVDDGSSGGDGEFDDDSKDIPE